MLICLSYPSQRSSSKLWMEIYLILIILILCMQNNHGLMPISPINHQYHQNSLVAQNSNQICRHYCVISRHYHGNDRAANKGTKQSLNSHVASSSDSILSSISIFSSSAQSMPQSIRRVGGSRVLMAVSSTPSDGLSINRLVRPTQNAFKSASIQFKLSLQEAKSNPWKYLSIPIAAAFIGYVTNFIGVKMIFYPIHWRGMHSYLT